MTSAISVLLLAAGATIAVTIPGAAGPGAPPQLLNKTVVLSWSSAGTARSDAGRSITYSIDHKMTIYISSAGRQFTRYSRSNRIGGTAGSGDIDPGSKKSPSGRARDARFQGNRLIVSTEWFSGASQMTATFDASFSSCTLSVTAGRTGGAALRAKGPDGVMYTLDSYSTVGPSCSVQNGNVFASQQPEGRFAMPRGTTVEMPGRKRENLPV